MDITLRPYQQECVDIINSLDPGSYLVVMATALGKTATFSHIERHGRVLILSHREELVYQPYKYYDCSFGVERAQDTSNGEEVISASVQTLIHRLDKFSPDEFDIIITDEAHHAVAPSYRKIYEYFHPRLHLGFTATPNRADNNYLGDIYSKIIYEKNIRWGIQNNYLSDIECIKVNMQYDLSNVKERMGDYAVNELDKAINIEECNSLIANVYAKYAIGPTLIFASSVEHAQNIANLIPEAVAVTHTTENRAQILQDFMDRKIDCLVNNLILTEGTDLPIVETIIMARPTKNISLYTQMVGRGTRLSPGKTKLRLIDCVDLSSEDICTAPILFGIDKKIAKKTEQDQGLLSDMEERIENVLDQWAFDTNCWKYNTELIEKFITGEGYVMHDVNYTMLGNKDLICSLGEGRILRITAPDILGNCTINIYTKNGRLYFKEGLKMQDALDDAWRVLQNDYHNSQSLWNIKSIRKWGSGLASEKQKDFIRKLYGRDTLRTMNLNLKTLTKYNATILINRKLEDNRKIPTQEITLPPIEKYNTFKKEQENKSKYKSTWYNAPRNYTRMTNLESDTELDEIFDDEDDIL